MSKFIGRTTDVGVAKETVRGTPETAATFYLPKLSVSYDDEIMQSIDESSFGVVEDAADASIIGKFAVGEIEGNIYDKSFGLLLYSGLGGLSTTGPTQTTVYTHAFSVAQTAQHQALTLFMEDANADYKYALSVVDSLEIDATTGKFCTYKVGIRSKVGATATLTPSYTAENMFLPQHASLKIATNLAGLGAASATDIRSVKINIVKNVEDDRKLGSVDPSDILNKQVSIEGSIELTYNDETFKTEMLANTQKAMRIRLTNTDVTIGTNLNPQITIDLAKIKVTKFVRKFENDGVTTATVDFKAFYSLTDAKMATVELINTQASY